MPKKRKHHGKKVTNKREVKNEIEEKFDEMGLKNKKEKELLRLQVNAMESEGNVPSQQVPWDQNNPLPH